MKGELLWKNGKILNGFEGLYLISNTCKVFSVRRKIELKPNTNKYGYYEVCLYNNKNYHKRIHRLVAEHFLEAKEGCNIVNHLDRNKKNNNKSNLEWTTVSGNTKHCFENNEKFRKQVMGNLKTMSSRRWCQCQK